MPIRLLERTFDIRTEAGWIAFCDPSQVAPDEWLLDGGGTAGRCLQAAAREGRVAPLRTPGGGNWRILLTDTPAPIPPAAAFPVTVRSGWGCLVSLERYSAGAEERPAPGGSGAFPLPFGRHRLEVRTPAGSSEDDPDYVLSLSEDRDRKAPPSPTGHGIPPAVHPVGTPPDPQVLAAAWKDFAEIEARGEPGEIRDAIERLLRRHPRIGPLYLYRSKLRRADGDYSGALEDVLCATRLAPNDGAAWCSRAHCHLLLARPSQALVAAVRGVELCPDHPAPWNHMADALHAIGRSRDAVRYWRKAIRLGHAWSEQIEAKILKVTNGG